MTKTSLFSACLSICGLGLLLASPVKAEVMEQHQTLENEVKIECSGTCTSSSSFTASQHQRLSTDDSSDWKWEDRPRHRGRGSRENRSGEVTLSWSQRGGTCTIRYTEATSRTYNYSTSAACDEGQLTIGGLVPGKVYRFQVKKDNEGWSAARRLTAE